MHNGWLGRDFDTFKNITMFWCWKYLQFGCLVFGYQSELKAKSVSIAYTSWKMKPITAEIAASFKFTSLQQPFDSQNCAVWPSSNYKHGGRINPEHYMNFVSLAKNTGLNSRLGEMRPLLDLPPQYVSNGMVTPSLTQQLLNGYALRWRFDSSLESKIISTDPWGRLCNVLRALHWALFKPWTGCQTKSTNLTGWKREEVVNATRVK